VNAKQHISECYSCVRTLRISGRSLLHSASYLVLLLVVAGSVQPQTSAGTGPTLPHPPSQENSNGQQPTKKFPGSITGTLVDATGASIAGATVKFTGSDSSAAREVQSDGDGQFSFANVPPGPFLLTVSSPGFAAKTTSGVLGSGEARVLQPITIAVATAVTEIQVTPKTQEEIADQQIKVQEQQRVLAVIPNFYVSYEPNPAPLNARQKFQLAWKTTIDPISFGLIGAIAGVEQATNAYAGYGQGAQGYGKRYGAGFADFTIGTFVGAAILPSILKQDPRYFYKGSGTRKSRMLYALGNAVVCKGDNGRWQPNYSAVLGSLAAGGLSNLYYPKEDRNGAWLTFQNALIGVGASAAANLIEEFVIPPRHSAKKHKKV
jgi:Carboxypeptidase regulatory-like domain